jgi:hypothetical protein
LLIIKVGNDIGVKMHPFIREVKKISHQYQIPSLILMAIRARIELGAGVENRIDQAFESGNKGVLLIGMAGSGKTRSMRAIYDGLNLGSINSNGRYVGHWASSVGGGSVVGIYQILETYNDSCIFLDELNLDTKAHCEVLKQISHGELRRPIHNKTEATPFHGLVISSCNGIKLPSNGQLPHLLATLDRFMVIRALPPKIKHEDYIDIILNGKNQTKEVDWKIIQSSLLSDNYSDLNTKEKELIKILWKVKVKEFNIETHIFLEIYFYL